MRYILFIAINYNYETGGNYENNENDGNEENDKNYENGGNYGNKLFRSTGCVCVIWEVRLIIWYKPFLTLLLGILNHLKCINSSSP